MKRLVLALLVCACPAEKKKLPDGVVRILPDGGVVTRNIVPLPQKTSNAEVEFEGTLDLGELKPARVVVLFSKTPCSGDLDVLQKQTINAGAFAGEFFFPQGTVAHVCAVALDDKGMEMARAGFAKNPVKLQGEGEIEVEDIALKLTAVEARPAPKGL